MLSGKFIVAAAAANQTGQLLSTFGVMALFLVFFYMFIIRPQRKRDKETKEMRDSLKIGDEVITVGGINGRIVNVKEDTIVVQVGADKTKIEFQRWAVGEVKSSKGAGTAKAQPKAEVKETQEEPEKKGIKMLRKKSAPAEETVKEIEAKAEETVQAAAEETAQDAVAVVEEVTE